ncbi:MAG: hypothetical protein BMS9Abin13_067 [Patescibacteria group bacterium]|nr:MAG: hypothetical protein BMS9Abin13_067 [Patescibacteria group bacterium]
MYYFILLLFFKVFSCGNPLTELTISHIRDTLYGRPSNNLTTERWSRMNTKRISRIQIGVLAPLLILCGMFTITLPSYAAPDVSFQNSVLVGGALKGDMETVRRALEKGANVNTKDKDGTTALMIAVLYVHTEVTKLLLDRGADVNAKDKDGTTALMIAALFGQTEIADILLKYDADVNAKDENGTTALMHATTFGQTEIIALLKAHMKENSE